MQFDGHLAADDFVARVESVVATEMAGEIIMMSMETGRYFHLDDIGTEVWQKLERPASLSDIVTHLSEVYDVQQEDCKRDTVELISKLLDFKVLKLVKV